MSSVYPLSTAEIRHKRHDLAPNQEAAVRAVRDARRLGVGLRVRERQCT